MSCAVSYCSLLSKVLYLFLTCCRLLWLGFGILTKGSGKFFWNLVVERYRLGMKKHPQFLTDALIQVMYNLRVAVKDNFNVIADFKKGHGH